MTGSSIWDHVLSRIETKVNRHIFYTWFKPTAFIADEGLALRVRVPNGLFRDWLTKHYAAVLEEALREVDRTGTAITFVTEDEPVRSVELVAPPPVADGISPAPSNIADEPAPEADGAVPGSLAP